MQQDLAQNALTWLSTLCVTVLPLIVLLTGLLMVSGIRYPHVVNRYLRGQRSLARLIFVLILILLLIVWHQYTLGIGMLAYALLGPTQWMISRHRRRSAPTPTS